MIGVDAAGDVDEFARTRAAERGLSTVKFEQTTIADIAVDEVDAVIGRDHRLDFCARELTVRHLPDS